MTDEQPESAKDLKKLLADLSSGSHRFRELREKLGLPRHVARRCFNHVYLSRRKDANPSYVVVYFGKAKYKEVKFVVRMAQPRRPETGIHDVAREYKIIEKLHEKGLPVPKPIFLSTTTTTSKNKIRPSFFIREFVEGSNFDDARLAKCYKLRGGRTDLKFEKEESDVDLKDKAPFRKSATKTLARLHRRTRTSIRRRGALNKVLTGYGAGDESFWKWRAGLWKADNDGPQHLTDLHNKVTEKVQGEGKANSFEPCLIHGDFNFRNLVFNDEGHVKAVLDWEMACSGDPMCDLSEFTLCRAKPKALDGRKIDQCQRDGMQELQDDIWKEYMTHVRDRAAYDKAHDRLPLAMPVACLRFAHIFKDAEGPHGEGHECRRDWREDRQLKDAIKMLSDEGMRNILKYTN